MDPESWAKEGSVFVGTDSVHGVGRASFTTSPDGEEHWIAYHTKVSAELGWERVIHFQPFNWNADGLSDFGKPISIGEPLARPSGGW